MSFYQTIQGFFRKYTSLWMRQAVKFGLVGGMNTLVDLSVYALLVHLTGLLSGQLVLAKAISYSAGIVNSFIWNRRWTFRSNADPKRTLIPFFAVNTIALGINSLVMHLCLTTLKLPEIISVLLATATTLVWNFLTSKYLVFRSPASPTGNKVDPAVFVNRSGKSS